MATTSELLIKIEAGGKKYFRHWIFRNLSYIIPPSQKLSVLGQNGSGKSTLLQILAGYESLSEGKIRFERSEKEMASENIFRHVTIAAPYLELIEEYTLREIVQFHFQFKPASNKLSTDEIVELTQLESSRNKVFKYFSSGMKQRTKLALAMLSDVDLVLLDEPLSNLDKSGGQWYAKMASEYLSGKSVIVCSNHNESEHFFCDSSIDLADYK